MIKQPSQPKDLTSGSIYKHLIDLALPASMGMLFNTLYNLTDNWFAGQISDDALVGLSISSMVFYLFIGLFAGLQNGTSVMLSSELGAKNTGSLKAVSCNSISVAVVFSLIVVVLGLLFAEDAIRWLSTRDISLLYAWDYIQVLIIGNIVFAGAAVAAGALMALGDTRSNRNVLVVGFFANILLNALLVFGFNLGVAGLAWATLIIKFCSAAYLLTVLSQRLGFKPRLQFDTLLISRILKQVVPASLNFLTMIVGSLIVTAFVSRFGDYAVAGYSVGLRLEQVLLLPALGLNAAVLAISGQNFGAKNYRRIAETYRKAQLLGLSVSVICIPAMIFLSPLFLSFFSTQTEIVITGVNYLRIDAIVFFCYVSLFISVGTLQATKQPNFPVIMGLLRQLLLPLMVNYYLIIVWGYSIVWLFASKAVIVIVSMVITLFYTRQQLKKLPLK